MLRGLEEPMTRIPGALALALLVSCGGDDGKDKDTGGNPTANPCSGLTATRNAVVGTAYTFTWSTEEAGTPSVSLAFNGETLDVSGSASGTDHSVTAVGLVQGGEYTWTASVATDGGTVSCPAQELKVPVTQGVLRLELNISEPGSAVSEGYLVISTIQADAAHAGIIDGQARYRMVRETDEAGMTIAHARISRDGTSILYNQFDQARVDDIGTIARVSLDGSVDTRTRTYLAHHDFVELPDGHTFAWMGYDRRDAPMDILGAPVGSEAALHCPGGLCPIAGEVLFEGEEGITEDLDAVEVMNWWDDWSVDPWWVCDHMWSYDEFVPDYYEWFHVNSLTYLESEDAYYLMSRYLDAIYKVDRATGALEWQLGGRDSDFAITDGEWFDHGHMSDVWEGGFLVFDNGNHRDLTRISEYAFDEDTRTVELVWSMDHPDGQMMDILGDAKRLPNGNRLVVWAADAVIQEITPAGQVVWEAQSASGGFGVIARADYVTELPQPVQ